MSTRRDQIERWFDEIVQKFREKGAIRSEKAKTVDELGLPPRFEQAMKRRLGQLGVFVEVNGKYYLSEDRLKRFEEWRSARPNDRSPRNRIMALRLIQLAIVTTLIVVLIVNFLVQSLELRVLSAILLVILLIVVVIQIYYLSRARRRFFYQNNRPVG